jgi:glycosyltransferase involved in cell wall biosynthesis
MIRVNIIAWHNAGGLSRDVDILANALPADTFDLTLSGMPIGDATVYRRRVYHRVANASRLLLRRRQLAAAPFDINLFLEDIVSGFFPYARRNVFIPNPEWFKDDQARHLKGIDAVLCKTRSAQETFASLHDTAKFISFTSEDRLDNSGAARISEGFLHLAGRSWQKGTRALTDVWLDHPEWPTLRVVQSARTYNQSRVTPVDAPNIDHILERLEDAALKTLQNSHAVHLCPSEAEGFGHVIAEAMSCGALVLTTNAPPMNELVSGDRGILVDYDRSQRQRAGMNYFVDPADLERKILHILDMESASVKRLGDNARAWFEENDREFRRLISAALLELA